MSTDFHGPSIASNVQTGRDVEMKPQVKDELRPDPFKFRRGIVPDDQLDQLRRRRKTGKNLEKYQRKQNELIDFLLKSMEEHTEQAKNDEKTFHSAIRFAVWASLIANLSLCVLQLYAAISSISLSLIATSIDSVFDFGSNLFLYYMHKQALKMDVNKWPVGGSRLETIGNIVYVESIRSLMSHEKDNVFHLASILAVAAALGN
ncbi:hypothetical protein SCLCIDRAFT_1207338, partial [Scleroderma citrinum Foug A]